MNLLCIEPVINSGGITALTAFLPGDKVNHVFSREVVLPQKFVFFCYDVFKVFRTLGYQSSFFWDVKILYELLGHRSETLIELGRDVLGLGETQRYQELSSIVNAHLKSYRQAKVDTSAFEIGQLLPGDLLHDLYLERAKVIKALYCRLTEEEKRFYSKFYSSVVSLQRMSENSLNVDLEALESNDSHYAAAVRSYTKDGKISLRFNAVGAKTGRIGFRKNSFNAYVLPKSVRSCIVASPDHVLVEIDFKSFQPRLAIFLTEHEEFKEIFRNVSDIYSVFPGDRKKNKLSFLAWMYAKQRYSHSVFDKYAWQVWDLRNNLVKQCKDKGFLETVWGRRLYLKDEENHVIFQNFITATEVDCILQLSQGLMEMGVKVLFPFHDSVVCEVPKGHQYTIEDARRYCEEFLERRFGAKFPVGVSTGNDFGNMHAITVEKV